MTGTTLESTERMTVQASFDFYNNLDTRVMMSKVLKAGFDVELTDAENSKIYTFESFMEENQKNIDKIVKELYPERKHTVRCKLCGRVLTNPESIALGIGPECIKEVQEIEKKYSVPETETKSEVLESPRAVVETYENFTVPETKTENVCLKETPAISKVTEIKKSEKAVKFPKPKQETHYKDSIIKAITSLDLDLDGFEDINLAWDKEGKDCVKILDNQRVSVRFNTFTGRKLTGAIDFTITVWGFTSYVLRGKATHEIAEPFQAYLEKAVKKALENQKRLNNLSKSVKDYFAS